MPIYLLSFLWLKMLYSVQPLLFYINLLIVFDARNIYKRTYFSWHATDKLNQVMDKYAHQLSSVKANAACRRG